MPTSPRVPEQFSSQTSRPTAHQPATSCLPCRHINLNNLSTRGQMVNVKRLSVSAESHKACVVAFPPDSSSLSSRRRRRSSSNLHSKGCHLCDSHRFRHPFNTLWQPAILSQAGFHKMLVQGCIYKMQCAWQTSSRSQEARIESVLCERKEL